MAEVQRSQAAFEFCHNPHAGSLLQGLQELRSDSLLTDVVLCVSGKEIPCHRNVLAACSEYFCAMFCNRHRESREHKVTIHEVSPGALQLLVDYAYTSKVTITEDNAVKLLEGANFFRILPVRDACETFISNSLSAKDCLQMMQTGNMLSCPDLEKKARLCVLKEFGTVRETPEFLSLTKDQLSTVISSDDLNASEEVVYAAVMTWINHNTRKRKRYMKELMELVRFPFMDKQYFSENVETNEAVRKSCHDVIAEARRCQHFPGEVQSPRTLPRHASGLREAVVIFGGRDRTEPGEDMRMTYSAEPTSSSWKDITHPESLCGVRNVAVLGTSDIIMCMGRDVWLYQLELDSWSKLAPMKLLRYAYMYSLVVLYGKVYAIGGLHIFCKAQKSVEVYNRRQNMWTEGVPLPQSKYSHACSVLDGSIYVMGGVDDNFEPTPTMYRFSPGDSQWQSMRDMPDAGRNSSASAVLNGSIYTSVGSQIFCFTPGKNGGLWSKVASGAPLGYRMTVFKGKIHTYGGYENTAARSAVMCLDPETQSLSHVGTMAKGLFNTISCVTVLVYDQ
ncbi:kelch-like protein 24 [Branchiostoma floridae x Branchiostoma japonicum]